MRSSYFTFTSAEFIQFFESIWNFFELYITEMRLNGLACLDVRILSDFFFIDTSVVEWCVC